MGVREQMRVREFSSKGRVDRAPKMVPEKHREKNVMLELKEHILVEGHLPCKQKGPRINPQKGMRRSSV